jgi:hypothetical protein
VVDNAGIGRQEAAVTARRVSDAEMIAGVLLLRIERWLETEGVFDVAGVGDFELAAELDWAQATATV